MYTYYTLFLIFSAHINAYFSGFPLNIISSGTWLFVRLQPVNYVAEFVIFFSFHTGYIYIMVAPAYFSFTWRFSYTTLYSTDTMKSSKKLAITFVSAAAVVYVTITIVSRKTDSAAVENLEEIMSSRLQSAIAHNAVSSWRAIKNNFFTKF